MIWRHHDTILFYDNKPLTTTTQTPLFKTKTRRQERRATREQQRATWLWEVPGIITLQVLITISSTETLQ